MPPRRYIWNTIGNTECVRLVVGVRAPRRDGAAADTPPAPGVTRETAPVALSYVGNWLELDCYLLLSQTQSSQDNNRLQFSNLDAC